MPHSAGITDPIGFVLAYIPVALGVLAMMLAFAPAIYLLALHVKARRSGPKAGVHEEGAGLEGHPSGA